MGEIITVVSFCYKTTNLPPNILHQLITMERSSKINTCPTGIESAYDVKDAMIFGLNSCKKENSLSYAHPLQSGLEKHTAKQKEIELGMLKKNYKEFMLHSDSIWKRRLLRILVTCLSSTATML